MRRIFVALLLLAAGAAAVSAIRSRRAGANGGPEGGGTPLSFDTWPDVPRAPTAA